MHPRVSIRFLAAILAGIVLASVVSAIAQDTIRQEAVSSGSGATSVPSIRPMVVPGTVVIPPTSQVNPNAPPHTARTNVRYLLPASTTPMEAPPNSTYSYETPASLACLYSLVTTITGCNPNNTVNLPSGGSQSIAIVDAFDDPEAAADLAYFSDQFGIPFSPAKFKVVYASGHQPEIDDTGGWEMEESVDIEYSHAMAPNAMLYLVEADSPASSDLMTAVDVATNLVRCGKTTTCPTTSPGLGEVSMSWGTNDFSGETAYDSHFTGTNVVYLAATGDAPGSTYPSVSPNVIAVGGTSISRSLSAGNFIREVAWQDAGGGISSYENMPTYQSKVPAIVSIAGQRRATPDIAADANPTTGVWVYDSFPMYGYYYSTTSWWIVGGTSVSTATMAGIINAADTANGSFAVSTAAELNNLYGILTTAASYAADFNDITYGTCNYYSASYAVTGYDFCTGIGSPKTLAGK